MSQETLPVGVFNTSILTTDGSFALETISIDEAKELVRGEAGFISAVGHESTAEILTTLLELTIPVNRIVFEQQVGQACLVFKLNGRGPEGRILTSEEIETIGFGFKKLTRLA